MTFGEFLTNTWIPNKRRQVRATTAHRYAWFVDRYINPAVGDVPLRRLRADHLDNLYDTLATTGGGDGAGRAPKTIVEVHAVIRAALDHAVARRLVDRNVARDTRSRRRPSASGVARSWTAAELSTFLTAARGQRLYPALHLAPTPVCDEARSSDSSGPTSPSRTPDCRCRAPCRTSAAARSSSHPKPAPAAAVSRSTAPPSTSFDGGDDSSDATGCRAGPTI